MMRVHRGQALVEMALILPMLLLLAFGTIDLGRVFYFQEAITNSARAGARYGSTHPTDTAGIRSHALDEASGINGITVNVFTNDPIKVTVTTHYEFDLVTPLVQSAIGTGSIELTGTSTMPRMKP